MPSPAVLDLETLLQPIPGDNPAGVDLRTDPAGNALYYQVKDARNAARSAERQLIMDGEESGGQVDWRPVVQHGTKALTEYAKDLEVAAYLVEALVRLHGFAGLRDGFQLARELVERFWDHLYPLPDEDGLETRVAPLAGLNGQDAEGTLINPIGQVPLTQGSNAGPYAYFHYQQAGAISQIGDEATREKRIQQGGVSLQLFERAVAETPALFFVTLTEDLTACQDEFAKLGLALDERCGSYSPPTSNIRSALAACLDTVTAVARDKLALAAAATESEGAQAEEAEAGVPSPEVNGGVVVPAGAIRSREDAFRRLLELADYFRRAEPHNPVSYALEQAVRWGRMSLPELLTELIADEAPRLQLFKQVGIRAPEPPLS
ncbi:MAG: type VI secretion system protein TssA [Gemmataceae bacterium]|nr:type VI secretion system protein TssA [Gemmataceae bacterium]